ncbi:MAG: MlaD family protein [Kofleriaceae bacterium]
MSVAIDDRRALQVGGVALALLAAAVVFVLGVWDHVEIGARVRFTVVFHHVGALQAGAPVVVAGREIGTIERLALRARDADAPREVVAHVAIDAGYRSRVPVDAAFFVSSRGLLSERLLEIGPGAVSPPARPIAPGDEVKGIDPPSLDQTLQQTWARLEIARTFLDEVGPEAGALVAAVRELGDTLASVGGDDEAAGELGAALVTLWFEAQDTRARLHEALGTGDAGGRTLEAARRGLDGTLAQIDGARVTLAQRWEALRAGVDLVLARLDAKAPDLAARARLALAAIDHAVERIAPMRRAIEELAVLAERGTLMKILTDPEFPEDSRELGKILKRQPWRIVGHPDDQADP